MDTRCHGRYVMISCGSMPAIPSGSCIPVAAFRGH